MKVNRDIESNEEKKSIKQVFYPYSYGPLREAPPLAVAWCVPKKNPTFSQNLTGSSDNDKKHLMRHCVIDKHLELQTIGSEVLVPQTMIRK